MTDQSRSRGVLSGPSLRAACFLVVAALSGCSGGGGPTAPPPVPVAPDTAVPSLSREFRGMWIATVANIDWPSQSGLGVAQQQAELMTLFDLAQGMRMNAVILHIRAAGDAMYQSSLEPWSRSLTGVQGGAPGYDPLAFALAEARRRGLELHAWFNPFRAGNLSDTLRLHTTHFATRRPDLTRRIGGQLWFDPGEQDVHDHTMRVILDVVRRYDLDGVHLDDFFYPYPVAGAPRPVFFPDSASYAKYVARVGQGALGVEDWRRDNINRFVERLYREVKAEKPAMKVGISPFGIWRPGSPNGIVGLDAYGDIYADSRLWLQRGWVDYLAPQLYWSTTSTGQNFGALLDWWWQQNTQRRHLWPGLASYRIADGTASAYAASEIATQIGLTRARAASQAGLAPGALLYNASSLRNNRGGISVLLQSETYKDLALPPLFAWIDGSPPNAPVITAQAGSAVTLRLSTSGEAPRWWLVQQRQNGLWTNRLLPSTTTELSFGSGATAPTRVVVSAIDQAGNVSPAARWP